MTSKQDRFNVETFDRALHDLKTPLTNIKTFSHLLAIQLQESQDSEACANYVRKIQSNLDRALDLLNSFAAIARKSLKNPQNT